MKTQLKKLITKIKNNGLGYMSKIDYRSYTIIQTTWNGLPVKLTFDPCGVFISLHHEYGYAIKYTDAVKFFSDKYEQKSYPIFDEVDGNEVIEGQGVTICGYTDCDPATIVEVVNPKTIIIRKDKAVRDNSFKPEFVVGGFAGHCVNQHAQKWNIEQNVDGELSIYTLRKNGKWVKKGQDMSSDELIIGQRKKFYDYNF